MPVAAAATAAWSEQARGMGPDEAGRDGLGSARVRQGIAGAGWGGTRRVGAGVGWVTRRAAASQGGAGRHRAEAGRRREGEEVMCGVIVMLCRLCRSDSEPAAAGGFQKK